ncbi:rhombosortase [Shewanella sp. YIC-542]|uniref:rhombosortase n=1 Tax=Shewanella mytili TaxID=3377111 RepID=UPI00398F0740
MSSAVTNPSPWLTLILLTLLCVLLQYAGLDEWLIYQRQAIGDGQLWRLLSGNLLHTNLWHLLMNMAGLWVVVFIHRMHYAHWQLALLLLLLLLLEGAGLYWGFPQLMAYVGLSGVLHGLFAYGALCDIRIGWRSGYLLLAGVTLKVIWEQLQGGNAQMTQLIDARVATEAHLVGLLSGVLLFAAYTLLSSRPNRNAR